MLGTTEILIIALILIFLFGGKKFVDWVTKIKHAKKELGKKGSKNSKK